MSFRTRENGDTIAVHEVGLQRNGKPIVSWFSRKIIEIVATRCHF